MQINHIYATTEPTRVQIDALKGATLLEFGTSWCEYCRIAQPLLAIAFENQASICHIKIEDGKGRLLGRDFGVKLWPTLVFLRDGLEITRLVRPAAPGPITAALAKIV